MSSPNFHIHELNKIRKHTRGFFRGSARKLISETISSLRPYIDKAKELPQEQRFNALKNLASTARNARDAALESGARSYSHPEWAAASVAESWLLLLLQNDQQIIPEAERLIAEMEGQRV